jgi:hypothetical protein
MVAEWGCLMKKIHYPFHVRIATVGSDIAFARRAG